MNDPLSIGNYFYFRFDSSSIEEIKVIEGEGDEANVTNIKINKPEYWYGYHVISQKDQKFFFQPSGWGIDEITMTFIDSSLEINLKLENFINYFFTTDFIYGYYEPNPLIFKIETIENDTFYNFIANRFDNENNKEDKISLDKNLLNYCIIDDYNECYYKELTSLKFERGKIIRLH